MLVSETLRDDYASAIGRLLPAEDLDSRSLDDAAGWIRIYERLEGVIQQVLDRTGRGPESFMLEGELDFVRERLGFWRSRYVGITGLDVDAASRTVRRGSRAVRITRRELELLDFLLLHPGRAFSSRELAVRAWHSPWLSDSQVRTYVMRLRHRVSELGATEVIDVVRDHGYRVLGAAGR